MPEQRWRNAKGQKAARQFGGANLLARLVNERQLSPERLRMPPTPQHGLLTRLLDYVVEQSKEVDPRAFVLTGLSDFRRFPKDLACCRRLKFDPLVRPVPTEN